MASSAEVPLDQLLKYKTWALKVSIHCGGCKRKVKKVLHKINGVYTISIDSQQQRVTVTGNVGVETLIKRLVKAGKYAEIWPENLAGDEKKVAEKAKNNGKQKDSPSLGNSDNNNQSSKMEAQAKVGTTTSTTTTTSTVTGKSKEKEESQRSMERENSPENTPAGVAETKSGGGGGGGGGRKKKKRQGQKGNNGNKIGAGSGYGGGPAGTGSQPANQGVSLNNNNNNNNNNPCYYYPQGYYYNNWPSSSLVYANRSYTTPHPSKNPASQFCYPPQSWPYTCASGHQEIYNHGSFEIFSDENANGCSVM